MAATVVHAEVQELLRFLTKEAKLPLAEAMPKIHPLRKMSLSSPEAISKAPPADLKDIFPDEKILKQVTLAAKRVSNPNKRGASAKKAARSSRLDASTTEVSEDELALPTTAKTEEELRNVCIETNRAPLFLAFAIVVLEHIHPDQPLSSRLSIAQAVVSAGAQSKAKYIGLTTSPTAEEDGWAQGQPKLRLLGRDVAVMRRHIVAAASTESPLEAGLGGSDHTSHEAFWGIDLEALRKSNGPLIAGASIGKNHSRPPIHTPQSARQYLLKSMNIASTQEPQGKSKKKSAAEVMGEKEQAAAMVLRALDIVCESWKDTLTSEELDRRASQWYAMTRPEVAQGQAGWGQRGTLKLSDILRLKRAP